MNSAICHLYITDLATYFGAKILYVFLIQMYCQMTNNVGMSLRLQPLEKHHVGFFDLE